MGIEVIVATALATAASGLLLHCLLQVFSKLFVEPLTDYKKCRSDVVCLLTYHLSILDSVSGSTNGAEYEERRNKAKSEIKMAAAKLRAAYCAIWPRWLAVAFGALERRKVLRSVFDDLASVWHLGDMKSESQTFETSSLAKDIIRRLRAEL